MKKIKELFILSAVFVFLCMLPQKVSAKTDLPLQPSNIREKIEFQMKQPVSKKTIALKFLLAMFAVAVSSVIIFVLLSIYNKLLYSGRTGDDDNETDDNLKTPVNMKEALNIFLKKTK